MQTLLEAFEAVSQSQTLLVRLEAAMADLSKKQGLREEKAWLEAAVKRVAAAREGVDDLQIRSLRLPELEPARVDYARGLQSAALDAVERLQAGIAFAAGSRAPLIEALFGKLKLPVLRRCEREDFEKFCFDFEKRLNTTYARRMFADPTFEIVAPVLADVRASFQTWRGVFAAEVLPEGEAQALRDELDAVARRLESPCRQARLLAEAALVPLRDILEDSGLSQKGKRRGKPQIGEGGDEHIPALDEDPPDPMLPAAHELLELELRA
jgi:hypothetical protein